MVKSLRIEFFQDPPREMVLVDGKEQPGVLVEVAFLDAPAGMVTMADFVYRLGGKGSTAGSGTQTDTETSKEKGETLPFVVDGEQPRPTGKGGE